MRITQLLKPVKSSSDGIEWVAATQCFSNDVMRSCEFDHSPHSTSGDDSGSIRSRLKQHMLSTKESVYFVRDSTTLDWNSHQMLFRLLNSL